MALTVSSSLNQKTWDATVRVTGGHPNQLWGIGAVQQAAEGEKLTVDRVLVRDADERMVGYAQLQIRRDNGRLVAEGQHVNVNRAAMVPAFMETLAGYVEDRYGAQRLSMGMDVPGAQALNDALTQRGWKRMDEVEDSELGPRRLRVPLGATEKALSSRLSADTLDRCRQGLRVSDVNVREITVNSEGVRAVGLKTGQINHLLKDLGQDSLLLVAAQERPDEQPEALGYLWFVHTVGLAMLYRVGFTRKARELGIDDALLLTGAVELQKRGVQRMDGGDSRDKDVPTVVRELADRERTVLGTWRKDLVEIPEQAVPVPVEDKPKKRRFFGRKKEQAAPEPVAASAVSEPEPRRVDEVRQQVSQDLGIEMTGVTPAQSELEIPAEGRDASSPAAGTSEAPSGTESKDTTSRSTTGAAGVGGAAAAAGAAVGTAGALRQEEEPPVSSVDRVAQTEKPTASGSSAAGAAASDTQKKDAADSVSKPSKSALRKLRRQEKQEKKAADKAAGKAPDRAKDQLPQTAAESSAEKTDRDEGAPAAEATAAGASGTETPAIETPAAATGPGTTGPGTAGSETSDRVTPDTAAPDSGNPDVQVPGTQAPGTQEPEVETPGNTPVWARGSRAAEPTGAAQTSTVESGAVETAPETASAERTEGRGVTETTARGDAESASDPGTGSGETGVPSQQEVRHDHRREASGEDLESARADARAQAAEARQQRSQQRRSELVARKAEEIAASQNRSKKRGALARIYAESLAAFKDAAGR